MRLNVNYTASHLEFGLPGQPPLFRLEAQTHQNFFRTLKKIELLIDGAPKIFWVKPEELTNKMKAILSNPDKIYPTTHTGSLDYDTAKTELNKLINNMFRENASVAPNYEEPEDPGPLLTSLYRCSDLTTLCCRQIFDAFTMSPEIDSSESEKEACDHAVRFLTSERATVRDCIASLISFRDHLPELLPLQEKNVLQKLDLIYMNLNEIFITRYFDLGDRPFPEFIYNDPLLLELYAVAAEVRSFWFHSINTYETAYARELPGKAAATARLSRSRAERAPAAAEARASSFIPTPPHVAQFLQNGITLQNLEDSRERSTEEIKSVLKLALGIDSFSRDAVHSKWRRLHPDLQRTEENKEGAEIVFKEVKRLIDKLIDSNAYR